MPYLYTDSIALGNVGYTYGASYCAVRGYHTGSAPPEYLYTSVGGSIHFLTQVCPLVQSFSSIKYSVSGGDLISANTDDTSYSKSVGKYKILSDFTSTGPYRTTTFTDYINDPDHLVDWVGDNFSLTYNFFVPGVDRAIDQPRMYDKQAFYIGTQVGTQVWTVLVTYDDNTTITYRFDVVVASPSTNTSTVLSFSYPSGDNAFQFGPWYVGTTDTPPVYSNTPVSWSDVTYWAGGPPLGGSDYALGCQAGGVAPWSFQGTIVNNTFSTGTAYCMQLGRNLSPDEIVFAKTKCNRHTAGVFALLGLSQSFDKYEYLPLAPKDSSGSTLYGCDSAPANTGDHPWAYQGNAFTVPTPNGPSFVVPPASYIPDVNGNLQSYYSDNPGMLRHIERIVPYTTVDIEFNFDSDYKTYLVWEPDGGIPIGMAVQPWSIRCNTYNQNGDNLLTWQQGRTIQSNWSDGGGANYYIYSEARGPFYLEWAYSLNNQLNPNAVFVSRGWKLAGGGANSGPAGGSTFGGASAIVAFHGPGLWNGSSANVGGANVAGMN